ncbi:hypothetical protein MKZ38_000322 [Zalerion maritima]|uniref:Kelch repeat-containing protein n=1 Tax=Zalerion maritima TaxID=339359 RepID=A0AAD5RF75_9PEZI|nr:hypothetical protein MKZ38_000322 [Zalerion maritima]
MAPSNTWWPRTDSSSWRRNGNSTADTTTTSIFSPSRLFSSFGRNPFTTPSILALVSSVLISVAHAKDPVQDFCRRWGHATTVIDDRLFIDGGYVNWEPIGSDPRNYTKKATPTWKDVYANNIDLTLLLLLPDEWFLYHNLSSDSAGGLPPLELLSKNSTIPNVIGGALWGDTVNKRVYAFGGELDLTTDAPPTGFSLYAYDALEDRWDELDRPDIYLNSPSFGGSVAVPEQGLGFYYGGWLGNATVPEWSGPSVVSDSLIVYDMDEGTWKNKTGPDSVGRAEGVLTYIPAGDHGFLVYFGGIMDPYGNGSVAAQPMNEIWLYDFVAEKWYSQTATGEVPDNRRRFCAGAAWAEDHSSYNIYLYGGISIPPNSTTFDDLWILSLPSFQWLKWYPEPDVGVNGEHPHHTLSCNVVSGGAQMIIVGGSFPYTDQCDSSPQYGSHNLMLGQQNPEKRKWEVFNTTLNGYEVPDDIVAIVGGDAKGSATATAPAGGFDAADLGVLMTRVASAATRTPTRDVNAGGDSTGLSTGAIVGIAIGCAAFIAGMVLGWFCLRRHRNQKRQSQYSTGPYSASDPFGQGGAGGSGAVWSPGSSQSPASPSRYYPPTAASAHNAHVQAQSGSYNAPAELPGAGNNNAGTWETRNSPSLAMHSPATGGNTTAGSDGKTDFVLVPVPVHRPSHSSGHSHIQSPSSGGGYPTSGMWGTPTSGGYMPVAQHGGSGNSPLNSPAGPYQQRPMTPQELSTDPRDPAEEPRTGAIRHQTYYHPTQG